MVLKVDRRRGLQSLAANAERRGRKELKTIKKREDEIIEEQKAKIERLGTRAHLYKGKEEQKIEKEQAFTLPLECWGFGKND